MKRSIRLAATISSSLILILSSSTLSAQQDPAARSLPKRAAASGQLHPSARIGSTPERRAAREKLSPQQRQAVDEGFRALVQTAIENARASDAAEAPGTSVRELAVTAGENNGTQLLKAQGREARKLAGGAAPPAQFRDFTPIASQKGFGSISTNSIVSTATWKSVAQFVNDFYQGALARQPDANEFAHWSGRLTAAQAQGRAQLRAEGQALGRALFESQEYVNRGRTAPHDYVYDLYKGFLQREPDQGGWNWWAGQVVQWGRPTGLQAFIECFEFEHKLYMLQNAAADADQDGFPQDFEDGLANFFTPLYFVSGNEPNSFARFGDFVPQVPIQGFGPNPVSHFRVQPLGWARDGAGLLYSFARIDYLTLWDNDNGLDFGFFCDFNLALTADFGGFAFLQLLDQLSSHPLDNERSAALVAARVEDFYFNPNANEYKAYDYFLSAHENTISDQSIFIAPPHPLPADSHVFLALSRSKHGTYEGNPDGLQLVPFWLQFAIYEAIEFAFAVGFIDFWTYQTYLNSADNAFSNCIVERFSDIGGQFANPRINVGEPNTPINGSGFIRANELLNKLNTPLWLF
jgi:hypothetical protein